MMLIRPFIKKGESFQSYLYRCARANSWNENRLKQHLRSEVAQPNSYDSKNRTQLKEWLSNISGRDEVTSLIDVWCFYSEFKEHFDFSRIKICPRCFKERKAAIPAYWYLRTYLVCAEHESLLTDVCTNCDEKLTAESVIAGKCINCHCDISNFDSENARSDLYSEKAYETLNSCNSHEMFAVEIKSSYFPLLRSIDILAPLTGLAAEIGYEYKQRRLLSIKQLYRYQLSCAELYQDREKLSECLVSIVNDHVSVGSTNLGKMFLKKMREFDDVNSRFFVLVVKDLLISGRLSQEDLTVSLSWIARLFDYEETIFVQYVEKEYSSIIRRVPRENISVTNAPEIISRFESKYR